MIKLIESFPMPSEQVEALADARREAQERSRTTSLVEKKRAARKTARKILKALLDGTARIGR